MGNKHSRALLSPHPSTKTINLATLDKNFIKASDIVHLIVIDAETGTGTSVFLKRGLAMGGVATFFARTHRVPVQGLVMTIGGTVIASRATADMVGWPSC